MRERGVTEADSMDGAIDWAVYEDARARMGSDFQRRLAFAREDGELALDEIEEAMRARSAVRLVKPAGTLKDCAYDFGADALGEAAERVELLALHCVSTRDEPDEALPLVAGLRGSFAATFARLDEAASPLQRKARAL